MQLTLYLLGSCLVAGTALVLYFAKHAPVGAEDEDGFVAAASANDGKNIGAPRPELRPGWEPLVRT